MDPRKPWKWFAVGTVLLLGVAGLLWRSQVLAAPRLHNIQAPPLPVDGRFVTATQEGRFMYLYFQTQEGVRVLQLDVSRIQSLGDEVHLVGVMDLTAASPPGPARPPRPR